MKENRLPTCSLFGRDKLTTRKEKQFKQYIKIGIFLDLKEPLIIWLYNILTMNLPNACYYRYVSSSNYSDFLKHHLHLKTEYWTRAIKRITLFDLLESLYSDTKILSKYIPSLQRG